MRSFLAQRASNSVSVRGGSRIRLRGNSASIERTVCIPLILPRWPRPRPYSSDVDLAFHRQKFVQDLLHDLLRWSFGIHPHEVRRHLEGIELALQQLRAHVMVFAIPEALLEHGTGEREQDEADVDRRNLRGQL